MTQWVVLRRHEWLEDVVDLSVDVHDEAVALIEAARLRRRLSQLPAIEGAVVRWRYGIDAEQLSVRQVAARLGVSGSTALAIERRAIDALRDHYGLETAA